MVIYSGFIAGLIFGFMLAFIVIIMVSTYYITKKEQTKQDAINLIDKLNETAKENIEKEKTGCK